MTEAGDRVARVIAAATAIVGEFGIAVDEPVVLRDLTNVLVRLDPAPVVARSPGLIGAVFGEDRERIQRTIDVVEFLASAGAPVAPPSDLLPAGPHERDGVVVTFWRVVAHDAARRDARAAGAALRQVHVILARYQGALPSYERALDLDALFERAERSGALKGAELGSLRAEYERIRAALGDDRGRRQPLHGDAHLPNVLWSPDGPLWNDFEGTCIGPIAYDLAPNIANQRLMGIPASLVEEFFAGYGVTPARDLEPFVELRALIQTVFGAIALHERPDDAAIKVWAERRLQWWRERSASGRAS